MKAGLLLTAVAGLLVGGPEKPSDSSMARTSESLSGEWVLVRYETRGEVDHTAKGSVAFEKEVMVVEILGETQDGTYWLDVARSPKAIDIVCGLEHYLGIYSLHGDRLTICLNEECEGTRPHEFNSDGTAGVLVYQRKKP